MRIQLACMVNRSEYDVLLYVWQRSFFSFLLSPCFCTTLNAFILNVHLIRTTMPSTEPPPPLSAPFLAFISNMGSLPVGLAVTALTGISLFGSLELLCSIFFTFRRYRGKYFYCMLIASVGVGVYSISASRFCTACSTNMSASSSA